MKIQPTKSTVAFCILHFTFSLYSNAQIVYTDIPDITLKCNHNSCTPLYILDLNNDGIEDFGIYTNYWSSTSVCKRCAPYSSSVGINSWNGGSGVAVKFAGNAPALTQGSEIGASLTWDWESEYRSDVLSVSYTDCSVNYFGQCTKYSGNSGKWSSGSDGYLGLAFIIDNQTYYGWIRLSVQVTSTQASCKILDYAVNSAPGQSISAGDTGNALVSNHTINKEQAEGIAPSKLSITPNPVASSATISFSLQQLEKVSLNLYDMTGRLVNKVAEGEFNEGVHQVTLGTKDLNAGIYILRVQTGTSIETKKLVVVK